MFRELLVAFDGSSHAQRALTEARDLAHATAGRLTVMTVVPEPSTWALSSGYGAAVNLDELMAEIEREYQTMLDSALDTMADDVPVNKILTRGPAGPVDRRRGKCK
jgi:nucleotide-binding universal stress UspA family protein